MSRQKLVGFSQNQGAPIQCIDSILRYCGYNEHLTVVDQAESHQFHKRKKISLRNKQIKTSKKVEDKLVAQSASQKVIRNERMTQKSNLRQLKMTFQQMSLIKEEKKVNIANSFLSNHQNGPHYDIAYTFPQQNALKGKQKVDGGLDYEQEFKRILFEDSEEVESQIYQQKSYASPNPHKLLESLCFHRSNSIYNEDESSSECSIILPFTYSQKMTASNFLQTKTSQSIVFPETKKRQSSIMGEESISDGGFEVFSFINPFQMEERLPIN